MRPPFPPPDGFEVERMARAVLYVREDWAAGLHAVGLGEPRTWQAALEDATPASGRGPVARLALPDGRGVVIKRMRRGGLAGPLWRGHYLGTSRLEANLRAPGEARRRGIATPEAAAMLIAESAPRLFRAWFALEAIEGAVDLHEWLLGPPAATDVEGVIGAIRRAHDAGVHHPDLHLGNVLVRRTGAGPPEVFLLDFDRARFYAGGIPFRLRQAALRRLERSFAKRFRPSPPARVPGPATWYSHYARGNEVLARRLEAGRAAGRLLLTLHRLGW